MRKQDWKLFGSNLLYFVVYVLLCMGICAIGNKPIWHGALAGFGCYAVAVFVTAFLTELVFRIMEKADPVEAYEYYSPRRYRDDD